MPSAAAEELLEDVEAVLLADDVPSPLDELGLLEFVPELVEEPPPLDEEPPLLEEEPLPVSDVVEDPGMSLSAPLPAQPVRTAARNAPVRREITIFFIYYPFPVQTFKCCTDIFRATFILYTIHVKKTIEKCNNFVICF